MLYNNTASINYLEVDRLNPSSSSTTINASITASLITPLDYRGTTQFLTHTSYPIDTYNTNILAPVTTSISVMRTVELLNNKINKFSGVSAQFTYIPFIQNLSNANTKTWRIYVNSTSSLTGATQIATTTFTTNAASRRDFTATFFISASTLFYTDFTVWNGNIKVIMPYDVVSSSIFIISTVQKAVGSDTVREHCAFMTTTPYVSINDELFPP